MDYSLLPSLIVVIILILLIALPAQARPLRFPATGQTTAYTDQDDGSLWEVKCDTCPRTDLHYVNNCNLNWNGEGTIWDWLNAVNAEGGTGYAGHNDWRIPNVRELQSIIDYGRISPAIDPLFGPTGHSGHWSPTTSADNPSWAWGVDFGLPNSYGGSVGDGPKINPECVRAVRSGPS